MLLPPTDETVLQDNPDFANLYRILTTSILNGDGTSKHDAAQKEREAIRNELNQHRLNHAKQAILISSLSSLVPEPSSQPRKTLSRPTTSKHHAQQANSSSSSAEPAPEFLSPGLVSLLLLLPPLLSPRCRPLSSQDLETLLATPPLSCLPCQFPQVAALVSSTLRHTASHLCRLLSPLTNPSYIHRVIPSLPSLATSLTSSVQTQKNTLASLRLACLAKTLSLLKTKTMILTALAKSVDAKHTLVGRHLELSSQVMALQARHGDRTAQAALAAARKEVYGPDAVRALGNYGVHLRDARVRVEESIRTLEMELAAYGVGIGVGHKAEGEMGIGGDMQKEKTMREVARVYRDMGRQIEEVGADLERLNAG